MNESQAPALPGFERIVEPFKFPAQPYQYGVHFLRECRVPQELHLCSTPEKAAAYWRLNISTDPYFNPECECFIVLMLDIKLRVKGHYLVSVGTIDVTIVQPREVFRVAIVASAYAIVLAHNHPSGDPTPTEDDVKVTRQLIRAGEILNIPVLEHVVIGNPQFASLRELGHISQ